MINIFKQWKTLAILMSLFFFSSSCSVFQKTSCCERRHHHGQKYKEHQCSKKKCSHKSKCKKCSKKKCEKCKKNRCNKSGCKLPRKKFIKEDDDFAQNGNVIFIHPDGMSVSHWDAIRLYHAGFEGQINYDKLPHTAIYRGTIRGQLTATSNAGATIHAYGIKTGKDSFGMDQGKHIRSLSNQPYSLLIEAKKKA